MSTVVGSGCLVLAFLPSAMVIEVSFTADGRVAIAFVWSMSIPSHPADKINVVDEDCTEAVDVTTCANFVVLRRVAFVPPGLI